MATLYITEFRSMQSAAGVGHAEESAPAANLPSLGTQAIVLSGSSQQSAVIQAATKLVRIKTDGACFVTVGASPTATAAGMPLFAGDSEYFGIRPGDKLAVIAA